MSLSLPASTASRRSRTIISLAMLTLAIGSVGSNAFAADDSARSSVAQTGNLTDFLKRITGLGQETDPNKDRTRFIVAIAKPIEFKVFALTAPNRVIIDMPAVDIRLPKPPANNVGVVKSFRGGRSGDGRSRVVINVTEPVVVENAVIRDNGVSGGTELVLDILPVKAKETLAAANAKREANLRSATMGLGAAPRVQPPLPFAAESPQTQRKKTWRPLIVLDPGHGGDDTGAKKHGVKEKDVVLAFALKLREKLLATGRYRVQMTRETDEFIPLGVRRAFAEQKTAQLFISIHADYARRAAARGATIYSLRERVADRLRAKASAQFRGSHSLSNSEEANIAKASASDVSVVRKILADLKVREVAEIRDKTSAFSETVVKHMSGTTNMRNEPDKEAAFKVLKTAKVPAVLIELAYVSNKEDAELLSSDQWRLRVSGSIVDAIDRYFSDNFSNIPI